MPLGLGYRKAADPHPTSAPPPSPDLPPSTGLGNVPTLCFDEDGIERLAAGHEQAVAAGAAEAEVAADFGQQDLADAGSVGGEDVDAVVAVADPAHRGPDIAVDVAADAVGKSGDF